MQSQDSADQAVAAVVEASGQLDVVIHDAGHAVVDHPEAFTAEEVAHLIGVIAAITALDRGEQGRTRSASAEARPRVPGSTSGRHTRRRPTPVRTADPPGGHP